MIVELDSAVEQESVVGPLSDNKLCRTWIICRTRVRGNQVIFRTNEGVELESAVGLES